MTTSRFSHSMTPEPNRMHRLLALLPIIALACVLGCRDRDKAARHERAQQTNAPAEGALCKEHGLPEASCTECNPTLIPAFKAKGDWCGEHGLPEYFCPICRSESGGRPTANAATSSAGHPEVDVVENGDGPPDGTKIRLRTKETARLAGLHFVQAVEQPTSREVAVTARVVYDATRVAQVNPRMPGVVRTIRADVGVRVRAGAPLAVIESADVGAEQSRFQSARTRLEVAEANYRRIEGLRADGISPEKDLLAARRDREEANAEVRAAQSALGMVGAGTDGSGRYTLVAPIAGVVTQRGATIGRLVDREDILFEVVDPSAMWIELDVPEADLPVVAVGQSVVVTLDGLPERKFTGAVSYIAPAVDSRTRTAVARVPQTNPDGVLRANLFGRGRIAVTEPRSAVLVPREAVQRARSVSLVFVRLAEDTFEARRVTTGSANGDLVSVTGRVKTGDVVVTEGSFLLKTETLKDSIGAGCGGDD